MSATDEIFELLETTGQNAPDMTQALKVIGGDMKSGIKKIGEFFYSQGINKGFQVGKDAGEKIGLLKGSVITLGLVTLVQCSFNLYGKHKEKKALKMQEETGREIVDAIKEAVPSAEDNELKPQPQGAGEAMLTETEVLA